MLGRRSAPPTRSRSQTLDEPDMGRRSVRPHEAANHSPPLAPQCSCGIGRSVGTRVGKIASPGFAVRYRACVGVHIDNEALTRLLDERIAATLPTFWPTKGWAWDVRSPSVGNHWPVGVHFLDELPLEQAIEALVESINEALVGYSGGRQRGCVRAVRRLGRGRRRRASRPVRAGAVLAPRRRAAGARAAADPALGIRDGGRRRAVGSRGAALRPPARRAPRVPVGHDRARRPRRLLGGGDPRRARPGDAGDVRALQARGVRPRRGLRRDVLGRRGPSGPGLVPAPPSGDRADPVPGHVHRLRRRPRAPGRAHAVRGGRLRRARRRHPRPGRHVVGGRHRRSGRRRVRAPRPRAS